jgi:hypothetical protein
LPLLLWLRVERLRGGAADIGVLVEPVIPEETAPPLVLRAVDYGAGMRPSPVMVALLLPVAVEVAPVTVGELATAA